MEKKRIFSALLIVVFLSILCFSAMGQPAGTAVISDEDLAKINGWKYRPDDNIYLEYKTVFDNPKYYDQKTGEIIWPPNGGAVDGTQEIIVLKTGTEIDRYGSEDGFYTTPINTPYEERSCAPGTKEQKPYYQYTVIAPIEDVEESVTASWFDEPGGGMQYLMPESVGDLIEEGCLERIE